MSFIKNLTGVIIIFVGKYLVEISNLILIPDNIDLFQQQYLCFSLQYPQQRRGSIMPSQRVRSLRRNIGCLYTKSKWSGCDRSRSQQAVRLSARSWYLFEKLYPPLYHTITASDGDVCGWGLERFAWWLLQTGHWIEKNLFEARHLFEWRSKNAPESLY